MFLGKLNLKSNHEFAIHKINLHTQSRHTLSRFQGCISYLIQPFITSQELQTYNHVGSLGETRSPLRCCSEVMTLRSKRYQAGGRWGSLRQVYCDLLRLSWWRKAEHKRKWKVENANFKIPSAGLHTCSSPDLFKNHEHPAFHSSNRTQRMSSNEYYRLHVSEGCIFLPLVFD